MNNYYSYSPKTQEMQPDQYWDSQSHYEVKESSPENQGYSPDHYPYYHNNESTMGKNIHSSTYGSSGFNQYGDHSIGISNNSDYPSMTYTDSNQRYNHPISAPSNCDYSSMTYTGSYQCYNHPISAPSNSDYPSITFTASNQSYNDPISIQNNSDYPSMTFTASNQCENNPSNYEQIAPPPNTTYDTPSIPKTFNMNHKLKQGLPKNSQYYHSSEELTIFNSQSICAFCFTKDDMLIKNCLHPICSVCICNDLEDYLNSCKTNFKDLKMFSCKKPFCKTPYRCSSFKNFTLKESFMNYLELESKLTKSETIYPEVDILENKTPECSFCDEIHDKKEISCCEFYRKGFLCVFCKIRDYEGEVKCEHRICRQCFIDNIIKILEDNPLDFKLKCAGDNCSKTYDFSLVYYMLGGLDKFQKLQQTYIDFYIAKSKNCTVCYREFKINKINIIPCGHEICNDCLRDYLASCLNINDINKINKCPVCESKIKDEDGKESFDNIFEIQQLQIMKILGEKEKALYEKLTLKNIKFDSDNKKLVLKWCKNCDYAEFMEINENSANFKQEFYCENCKQTYCAKCNESHTGIFCNNSWNARKNLKNERFAEGQSFIACPNCKEAVFRCNGCNFLKCLWPSCKGVNFCALCQKRLDVTII